jgi:hypothetical protein
MFPPIEAYAVNFANGNLQPHVNPYGWPNMQLTEQVENVTWALMDSGGWSLNCSASGAPLGNSLYLVLPEPGHTVGPPTLPGEVRAFLRVSFDLPHATAPDGTVFKEAWAVAANLRIDRTINSPPTQQIAVTAQFVKGASSGVEIDGVRLNTPGSLQQAVDQARRLDGPLEYARYQPIWFFFPAPVFVLDHAFCGYAAASNGHTPGSGTLRIRWPFFVEQRDHRVYSSTDFLPLPVGSTIGAVGVSVGTNQGVGTFGARVRTFELWLDQELKGPVTPPPVG